MINKPILRREKMMMKTDSIISTWLLSVIIVLSCSPTVQDDIKFSYSVIDDGAMGHRLVGDVDGDGFNDIVAVNHTETEHLLVWYKYPGWEKKIICDIHDFEDYQTYRSCDMDDLCRGPPHRIRHGLFSVGR
jgi:hypothetical protein